jgi:hypothetical protein
MRKSINEITHWEPVEVFGKRCIFTPERVDRTSLPEGFYMYECRSYDDDWGLCCEIALGILVNFFGTIISNEPIPVDFELYGLCVRNGDDNEGNKVIDGPWDIEWIDEWVDDEIEKYEPVARSFDEYQHSNIESSWNIPDECKCIRTGTLYIDKFDDTTKDKVFDATTLILSDDETKNHYPKFKIIIDIKSMNAKQINQIREIMYHVRSLYEEKSSMYEQERIVFTRTKSIEQLIKEVREDD